MDLGLCNTAALYSLALEMGVHHKKLRPRAGDVVFFDNTYDRDRDGRNNDELSHVAIVEWDGEDGTIHLIHNASSKGVSRIVMNLEHPEQAQSTQGKAWNSHLRAKSSKGPRGHTLPHRRAVARERQLLAVLGRAGIRGLRPRGPLVGGRFARARSQSQHPVASGSEPQAEPRHRRRLEWDDTRSARSRRPPHPGSAPGAVSPGRT